MSQRPLRSGLALFLAFGLGLTACSQAKRDEVPPDCAVMDQFDLQPVSGFFSGRWYPVPDHSAQYGMETSVVTVAPIPAVPPPVCDLTEGILFSSHGNHDWGSFIGVYHDEIEGVVQPLGDSDARGFEGLSFWAKSKYDKGLTLELADTMSDEQAKQCIPSSYYVNDAGMEVAPDAGGDKIANPAFTDEYGVPVPNGCGNAFDAMLVPTERWAFYTIPFKNFRQTRQDPSLKPNGLDLANIFRLLIRAPRGAIVEASFVNFAWYRKAN